MQIIICVCKNSFPVIFLMDISQNPSYPKLLHLISKTATGKIQDPHILNYMIVVLRYNAWLIRCRVVR